MQKQEKQKQNAKAKVAQAQPDAEAKPVLAVAGVGVCDDVGDGSGGVDVVVGVLNPLTNAITLNIMTVCTLKSCLNFAYIPVQSGTEKLCQTNFK